MAGSRVVEHVSSVADAGNHSFLGVGEFHAQAATDAPAQTAGGGTAKITCRLAQAELLLRYAMIVDDESIFVPHLVNAIGQPCGIDRSLTARFFRLLLQPLTIAFVLGADFLGARRQ